MAVIAVCPECGEELIELPGKEALRWLCRFHGLTDNPRKGWARGSVISRSVPVWVNKRSGVAHRQRDCEALRSVPDGALRQAVVENGLPRFRYCSRCSGA